LWIVFQKIYPAESNRLRYCYIIEGFKGRIPVGNPAFCLIPQDFLTLAASSSILSEPMIFSRKNTANPAA